MRAWQLRRLGPGSSKKSFEQTVAPERFGDIQLELNAEYRFFLADISGVVINSVFFTDIGNIWFLRENPDFDNGHFELNRLGKDLAIGAGTGLRVDFGPFLYACRLWIPCKKSKCDYTMVCFKTFEKWAVTIRCYVSFLRALISSSKSSMVIASFRLKSPMRVRQRLLRCPPQPS
jgi:hypothetical protein